MITAQSFQSALYTAQPAQPPAAAEHSLPFTALPEATRQRLVAFFDAPGWPVIADHGRRRDMRMIGAILLSLIAVLALHSLFYAGLSSRYGDQSAGFVVGYGGLVCVCSWGILYTVRAVRIRRRLPRRSGRYISAHDFIDARGPELRVRPLSDLVEPIQIIAHSLGHASLVLHFRGGVHEVFAVRGRPAAEAVVRRLGAAHTAACAAFSAGDVGTLGRLDPLFELRQLGWQVPRDQPTAMPLPLRHPWLPALVAGAVLGLPTWLVRREIHDTKVLAFMRFERVSTMRRYVEQGGRYSQEVRALIHERFETARRGFHAQAVDDPRVTDTFDALLTWVEEHELAKVPVRFRASQSALAELDASLSNSGGAGVLIAPIAPHFTPDASMPRERDVTNVLHEGLQVVIPAEIFTLEYAGRVPDSPDGERGPVDQPEIEVSYTVLPSGSVYTSAREPNRGFVGILVRFEVVLRVPGKVEPFHTSFEVQPPATFEVKGGMGDAHVYTVMAQRAFDELREKLVVTFFRPGSAAHGKAREVIEAHEAERARQDRSAALPSR
jgi:hypothetical protein